MDLTDWLGRPLEFYSVIGGLGFQAVEGGVRGHSGGRQPACALGRRTRDDV